MKIGDVRNSAMKSMHWLGARSKSLPRVDLEKTIRWGRTSEAGTPCR